MPFSSSSSSFLFASLRLSSLRLTSPAGRAEPSAAHIDSPPSRSPGRNELSDDGVARCWSAPPSMGGALHRELVAGLGVHS